MVVTYVRDFFKWGEGVGLGSCTIRYRNMGAGDVR